MIQPRPAILSLLFACLGCGDGYDTACPLFRPETTVVQLPYEDTLNKGQLRITIKAIPGRTDAVQVKADMQGFYERPCVEWTQEGCSVKRLPLDKGLERYDIDFLEMHSSAGAVSQVKLAVLYKFKSGRR